MLCMKRLCHEFSLSDHRSAGGRTISGSIGGGRRNADMGALTIPQGIAATGLRVSLGEVTDMPPLRDAVPAYSGPVAVTAGHAGSRTASRGMNTWVGWQATG